MVQMNFRRKLKLILKNAQKYPDRDEYVYKELKEHGLYGSFFTLNMALKTRKNMALKTRKAKGRHFSRLGKAAKKQNLLVKVWEIAYFVEKGKDLREIKFCERNFYVEASRK